MWLKIVENHRWNNFEKSFFFFCHVLKRKKRWKKCNWASWESERSLHLTIMSVHKFYDSKNVTQKFLHVIIYQHEIFRCLRRVNSTMISWAHKILKRVTSTQFNFHFVKSFLFFVISRVESFRSNSKWVGCWWHQQVKKFNSLQLFECLMNTKIWMENNVFVNKFLILMMTPSKQKYIRKWQLNYM